MDWTQVIIALLGFLDIGAIAALITTLAKLKQARRGEKIDNDSKILNEYKEYIELQKQENSALKEERDDYKQMYTELWKEINALKGQIATIESQSVQAKQIIAEKEQALKEAYKEIENLKAKLKEMADKAKTAEARLKKYENVKNITAVKQPK